MASPSITSVTTTNSGSGFDSAGTAHLVAMPATVAAGDLLIALIAVNDEATSITTPSGWTLQQTLIRASADLTLGIYLKDAAGDEDGTTVDFVTGVTCGMVAMVGRVLAAEWDGTLSTGVYTGSSQTGITGSPNPLEVAPGVGSKDFRFLAVECSVFDRAVTAYPTNYADNNTAANSGTLIHMAIASRALTAASDDPGAFTTDSVEIGIWIAIAIAPTAGTAVLTGTAVTGGVLESEMVPGGQTIIATLTGETYVPASAITTITYVNNALGGTTTTTSFSITLPATQAGDIIILEFTHRGTGDGTIGGTYSGGAFALKHSQLFNASAFSGKTYWSRATGNHTGETVTGADLTNSCAAAITIYRGCVASGDPLAGATIVGEENASGNETQAEITTGEAGCMVVLAVAGAPDQEVTLPAATDPATLVTRAELLSTGGTDTVISHASALKATAGATGAFTWSISPNVAGGSWAYAIKPAVTTPFADARQAFINGFDSGGSEAGGWDAKIKPNIPVANVVRTSDTVVTMTLQAQADYVITANETITGTIPGSILTGGSPIVATPTFTITNEAGIPEIDLAGSLPAMSGALTKEQLLHKSIAGSLPAMSGALAKQQSLHRALAGSLPAASGALSKKYKIALAGALPTATGALVAVAFAEVAGSLPSQSSSLSVKYKISLIGSLSSQSGALSKKYLIALAGSLPSMSGAIAAASIRFVDLAGALPASTGSISVRYKIALTGALPSQSGTLDAFDNAVELAGNLPSQSGVLSVKYLIDLMGNLPAQSSTLTPEVLTGAHLFGDLPAMSGSLAAQQALARALAGALPSQSGSLSVKYLIDLTGNLPSQSGALAALQVTAITLTGSLPEQSGSLTALQLLALSLIGSLPAMTGSLAARQMLGVLLAGALAGPSGSLSAASAAISVAVAGSLPEMAGVVNALIIPVIAQLSGRDRFPARPETFNPLRPESRVPLRRLHTHTPAR